jgi:hypothetical protein
LLRAQVAGFAAQLPETQAGPAPASAQSQLVVHWPTGRPPSFLLPELPLLLLVVPLPPLLLLPPPPLVPHVPAVQVSPVGQSELAVQIVHTPWSQLPASSAVAQSVSLVQEMVVPLSVRTAVLGLQEQRRAAVVKAKGRSLRMAASLAVLSRRNYRQAPGHVKLIHIRY